ncbi:MAG: glycosyltransferase [Armatimonadetes bacterium]|nr:glycosyltransferase [Armatimonadota bacterium]MDE2206617.1 glycosyltransferase [Armatimonadota bacterium]
MHVVHQAVVWLLTLCLAAFAGYQLALVAAARDWLRSRLASAPENKLPGITILKPVAGADPHLADNIRSFCRQRYPVDRFQLLIRSSSVDDPALEIAREVGREFPEHNVQVLDARLPQPDGLNRKVCNLVAMLPNASHPFILLSDSDMRVGPDYLRAITAPFVVNGGKGAKIGMVTAPYRGTHPESLAAVFEALAIGADFLPGAFVSRRMEGVKFAFGSTIVLPAALLQECGGLEPLRNELADDYLLAQAVLSSGHAVVLSTEMVDDVLGAPGWRESLGRRLRWMRTVRACRPAGHLGSVVTHGWVVALTLLAVTGASPFGLWAVAFTLALRLSAAELVGRCTQDLCVRRFKWWLPVADVVTFAIFVASVAGRTITWRGVRLRIGRGGRLIRTGNP